MKRVVWTIGLLLVILNTPFLIASGVSHVRIDGWVFAGGSTATSASYVMQGATGLAFGSSTATSASYGLQGGIAGVMGQAGSTVYLPGVAK